MSARAASIQIRLDVPYGGGPEKNLCVDLYSPISAGAHPALLCLHGGAWQHGTQRQYQSWGPWLAERGYVVVAVDYRLSQVSPGWPGVWHDVCRSLDWLIENASSLHVDPSRIATIGDSVGAHMAAMLSLDEKTATRIRAMVGVYGVYDLPEWWRFTDKRSENPVVKLMGKAYGDAKDDYETFSPLHRLQQLEGRPLAKYFIVHGDQDTRVHHNQSERFIAALREKQAKVDSMLISGAGHSWFTFAEDHTARRRVDEEPNASVAPKLLRFLKDI